MLLFSDPSGFWNDCKLPDYEEVVGHPPTPPPPYSENPPESTQALVPQISPPDSASVPEILPEPSPRVDRRGSGSQSDHEMASLPVQGAPCQAEENVEALLLAAAAEEEEEEEDEELITRRRHVTGDSGIEVCVCQLDVDECSGLEEEGDEDGQMCNVTNRDCCSGHQQETFRQKESNSELPSQNTSTGDNMVWCINQQNQCSLLLHTGWSCCYHHHHHGDCLCFKSKLIHGHDFRVMITNLLWLLFRTG